MSALKAAMQAMDFSNAAAWVGMGLKEKQIFDVFGAYLKGAQLPRAGAGVGINALAGLKGNLARGAARSGLFAFGALAAWNMVPRSTALAVPAAIGAGSATAYAMGHIPGIPAGNTKVGIGLRAAGGLLAGSLAYQGLRSAGPEEYQVRM